jgi:putative membrane protein
MSPSLLAQTAGFTLRAVGMIRGVARAYGHRPGRFGMIPVIRHVFADLAYLSVVDIVLTDTLPDLASGVTGKITKGFVGGVFEDLTEGLVAASRMSRLGMITIKACRPMPLSKAREKKLSQGVGEMLAELAKPIFNKLNPFSSEEAVQAEAR